MWTHANCIISPLKLKKTEKRFLTWFVFVCVCVCVCIFQYFPVFGAFHPSVSILVVRPPWPERLSYLAAEAFLYFPPIWHQQLYPPALFKYLAIPAEEAWYWDPSRNFLSHLKYKYLASDNGLFEQNMFDLLSCQKGQTADVNCEKYQIGKKSRDCIKMTNWPQAGRVVHIPGLLVQFCGN